MGRNGHPRAHPRAFTLFELMVVVLIVAIVAGVVVPGFGDSAAWQLSGAARMIASDLQYVQSLALAKADTYKVEFDTAAGEYRALHVAGATDTLIPHPWNRQDRFGGLFKARFDAHSPYADVTVSTADFGGSSHVQFDALGAPSSAGYIELQAGNGRIWVIVRAGTGSVKVTDDSSEVSGL